MNIRVMLTLAAFVIATMPTESMAKELKILQYGAWGLSIHKDPFKNRYPVVSYLPPGTILFDTVRSPLNGYVTVLPQYGHKLHIKERIKLPGTSGNIKVFSPIDGLVNAPPTDNIIFHKSVLCLGQSNRISEPPYRCKKIGADINSTLPVGKGWIYAFEDSNRGVDWLDLNVVLDASTLDELNTRGIKPEETNFDITKRELSELEKQGTITMLNKNMPPLTFRYETIKPAFIKCGQKRVTEKSLKASMGIKASAEIGGEVPFWARLVSGLQAKLGLSVAAEGSADANKTWSISIDTTNSSYLYYTVQMTNQETGQTANILIEKIFECRGTPNKPGERIKRVVFEIDRPGSPDIEEYTFEDHEDYIAVPDELLQHIPRPAFLSVNSPEQHADVLMTLVEKQSVDVPLAHFMVSHLNNTCQSSKRSKCRDLILAAEK